VEGLNYGKQRTVDRTSREMTPECMTQSPLRSARRTAPKGQLEMVDMQTFHERSAIQEAPQRLRSEEPMMLNLFVKSSRRVRKECLKIFARTFSVNPCATLPRHSL
jgi:hypothetical protein